MKKFILASLFAIVMAVFGANAANPVKWTAIADVNGDEGKVVITAEIEDGWYIYDNKSVDGVTPTKFDFNYKGVKFDGNVRASSAPNKTVKDKTLDTTLCVWTGKVKFERKFTVEDEKKMEMTVVVSYMACNGEKCTAPITETITVNIK